MFLSYRVEVNGIGFDVRLLGLKYFFYAILGVFFIVFICGGYSDRFY